MNSADKVLQKIEELKTSGIPLSDAAWEAAKACVGWPYIYGDRGANCTPSHRQAVFNKYPEYTTLKTKCQCLNAGKASCVGCQWFPGGKRVRAFDCRGFTYWILLQIYGWKLEGAGATSQWNTASNWRAKGEIKDGLPQNVIVCLFYYKKDEHGNRTKTLSHTGLYYNGETIECSNGVQHSKTLNKKWEVWAVPACVEGDVTPVPPPAPEPGQDRPTLKRGSKGEYVTLLQTRLLQLGYDIGSAGIDGDFGRATEAAVKQFQRDWDLAQDGIVGRKTWAMLDSTPEKKVYKVTIQNLTKAQTETLTSQYANAIVEEM